MDPTLKDQYALGSGLFYIPTITDQLMLTAGSQVNVGQKRKYCALMTLKIQIIFKCSTQPRE